MSTHVVGFQSFYMYRLQHHFVLANEPPAALGSTHSCIQNMASLRVIWNKGYFENNLNICRTMGWFLMNISPSNNSIEMLCSQRYYQNSLAASSCRD